MAREATQLEGIIEGSSTQPAQNFLERPDVRNVAEKIISKHQNLDPLNQFKKILHSLREQIIVTEVANKTRQEIDATKNEIDQKIIQVNPTVKSFLEEFSQGSASTEIKTLASALAAKTEITFAELNQIYAEVKKLGNNEIYSKFFAALDDNSIFELVRLRAYEVASLRIQGVNDSDIKTTLETSANREINKLLKLSNPRIEVSERIDEDDSPSRAGGNTRANNARADDAQATNVRQGHSTNVRQGLTSHGSTAGRQRTRNPVSTQPQSAARTSIAARISIDDAIVFPAVKVNSQQFPNSYMCGIKQNGAVVLQDYQGNVIAKGKLADEARQNLLGQSPRPAVNRFKVKLDNGEVEIMVSNTTPDDLAKKLGVKLSPWSRGAGLNVDFLYVDGPLGKRQMKALNGGYYLAGGTSAGDVITGIKVNGRDAQISTLEGFTRALIVLHKQGVNETEIIAKGPLGGNYRLKINVQEVLKGFGLL